MANTPKKPESNAEAQTPPKSKLKLNIVKATVLEPRIAPAVGP